MRWARVPTTPRVPRPKTCPGNDEDERQRVWYYIECVCVCVWCIQRGLREERVLQFQTADVKEKGSGQPLEGTFLVLLINYLRAYTAPCNQIYIIACKTFLLACVCVYMYMCWATWRKGFSRTKKPLEIRKFDRISNNCVEILWSMFYP